MSDKPISESRRDALKAMMGGLAAVPLMNLVGVAAAQAEDLEKVDEEKDPTALALEYRHDATVEYKKKGDKEPKAPKAPEDQTCANCQFLQAGGTDDWRPCQLFPGKLVAAKGWCASWMKKQGA